MSTPPRLPDPSPIPARDPRDLIDPVAWESVTKTVLDGNPGMDRSLAERIVAEGLRFVVAAATTDIAIAPSRVVDEGWHALILHTAVYEQLCGAHGRFVHHFPGYDPTHYDPHILDRAQERIRAAGFGIDPELWQAPVGGTVSVAAKCQHSGPECSIVLIPKKPGATTMPDTVTPIA